MNYIHLSTFAACIVAAVVTLSGCATSPGNAPQSVEIAPNKLTSDQALAKIVAERDAYFLNAKREVYRGAREILAQDLDEIDRGLKYRKIIRGNLSGKEIALTFDDGPHPAYTPRILAILAKYDIKATFFVVGSQAEKFPDLVRAESEAGHSVGNHTYHHVSLPKIPQMYVADEIKACGDVIKATSGKPARLFRPPGGEYTQEVAEAASALGYTMVLWTDDPGDYASPGADVILQRTLDKANDGGIILIHDGIEQTVEILPELIETLQKEGYRFVTVDEMIDKRKQTGNSLPESDSTQRKTTNGTMDPLTAIGRHGYTFAGTHQNSMQ